MKNNRIKNFNDFVNESYNPELNEGFFSSLANLIKREQDGTLKKSDSINQQALELQKKVAEMQKKSVAQKKIESLEK
jgi:hypothetical protein